MIRITEQLECVQERIRIAAAAASRDAASVKILAVSKQQPAAAIRAALAAGQTAFGENYLQEARQKIAALADTVAEWHFIGKLQRNKTRAVAEHFSWLHTLDRKQVAVRLNAHRPPSLPALNVCIQVKLADESTKAGASPGDLGQLVRTVADLPNLRLRGLMCIPPASPDPEAARSYFRELRILLEQLNQDGFQLDTLSMGMSADLEVAISEGATLVRVGTAIFGPRPAAHGPGT